MQPVPGFFRRGVLLQCGHRQGWDCSESSEAELPIDHVYHTLKIRVAKGQNADDPGRILPIEQVGEVPLPDGDRVVFLGRFRDSMKAFRVVERCREIHSEECARYAPKVVRSGSTTRRRRAGKHRDHPRRHAEQGGQSTGCRARGAGGSVAPVVDDAITESIGTLQPRGLLAPPASMKHVLWVDLAEGNMHGPAGGWSLHHRRDHLRVDRQERLRQGRTGRQEDARGVYQPARAPHRRAADDFYGSGAYTLNYEFRRPDQPRSGSGIWLHGLPKAGPQTAAGQRRLCRAVQRHADDIGRYVDRRTRRSCWTTGWPGGRHGRTCGKRRAGACDRFLATGVVGA